MLTLTKLRWWAGALLLCGCGGGSGSEHLALVEGSLRLSQSAKPSLAACGAYAFDLAVDFIGNPGGAIYAFHGDFAIGAPNVPFAGERSLEAEDIRLDGNSVHFEFCAPNTGWRGFTVDVWLIAGSVDTNHVSGTFTNPHYGS